MVKNEMVKDEEIIIIIIIIDCIALIDNIAKLIIYR